MKSFFTLIKQKFCNHVCLLSELTARNDSGMVSCKCIKCDKNLIAPYGLAIDCRWIQNRQQE